MFAVLDDVSLLFNHCADQEWYCEDDGSKTNACHALLTSIMIGFLRLVKLAVGGSVVVMMTTLMWELIFLIGDDDSMTTTITMTETASMMMLMKTMIMTVL